MPRRSQPRSPDPAAAQPTASASTPPVVPPPARGPVTLTDLAHRIRARMLEHGVRIGCTLRIVPVHGRDGAWMLLRARGRNPQLPVLRPQVPSELLDVALQVDLLLRWIDPPPPAGPGRNSAAQVDRLAPLALLVERDGLAELSDVDVGWWQAFRIAAGVVGRRAVAACLICPTGVRDIRDQHDDWPTADAATSGSGRSDGGH